MKTASIAWALWLAGSLVAAQQPSFLPEQPAPLERASANLSATDNEGLYEPGPLLGDGACTLDQDRYYETAVPECDDSLLTNGGQPQPPQPAAAKGAQAEKPAAADSAEKPAKKPAAPPNPFKLLFFENDYGYLQKPHEPLWGECLKELARGECCDYTLSIGGELRFRYMDDHNRFRPEYPADNAYELWRWRQFVDFRYQDLARVYVELIDASVFHEELSPLAIDVNRWDLQNAFVDFNLLDIGQEVWFRAGRQELLHGAQRLIAPLDWANTRRTFEGYKLFTRGKEWDVDIFSVRPNLVFRERFDHGDTTRTFSGVYATYKGMEHETFDMYWLYDREQEAVVGRADGKRQTVGGRWLHKRPITCGRGKDAQTLRLWEVEVEGAYQFGHDNNLGVRAGFLTAGVGHTWSAWPWQPNIWCYFDWASGDRDPADGVTNTFNQLYPLGHYFFGFFDGVARQNIIDYNIRATLKPTPKLTLIAWLHFFELDQPTDALYNVSGAPFARNAPGSRYLDAGEELDLRAIWTYSPNADLMVGYSWYWVGGMLENSVENRTEDGSFFHAQMSIKY